jgi:CheY-like chemotaxis protein
MGRILIVDDDPDAREILDLILRTLDIPILQATNGQEALEMIESGPLLLIVLDLSMPHLDGEGVLSRLRENQETASIPVIIYTAKTLADEELVRLDVPMSMVVRKGRLSMTHLRDLVIEILGSRLTLDRRLL